MDWLPHGEKNSKISLFVLAQLTNVSDRRTDRQTQFKLYKKSCSTRVRSTFFIERVVNTWNSLPASVDFSSFHSFKRTVKLTDLSAF